MQQVFSGRADIYCSCGSYVFHPLARALKRWDLVDQMSDEPLLVPDVGGSVFAIRFSVEKTWEDWGPVRSCGPWIHSVPLSHSPAGDSLLRTPNL